MAPAALTKTSSDTGTTEKDASAHSISGTGFAGPLWLRPGVGDLYAKGEVHTGPFSMPLLRMQNLDKLVALPGSSSGAILDVCCGSGVTTHHLHTLLKEQGIEGQIDVTCGDWSDGQLAYLDQRIKKMGWMKTRTVKMNLEVRYGSRWRYVPLLRVDCANLESATRKLDNQMRHSTILSALRAYSSLPMPSPQSLVRLSLAFRYSLTAKITQRATQANEP